MADKMTSRAVHRIYEKLRAIGPSHAAGLARSFAPEHVSLGEIFATLERLEDQGYVRAFPKDGRLLFEVDGGRTGRWLPAPVDDAGDALDAIATVLEPRG